jgi:chromate transporter
VLKVFLRLGATAFGGPAAHIGFMREEVVKRRHWLSDDEFLDLVAAVHLIPGPNSTELAIHLGYRRAGWAGLAAAGVAFIVPAFVIVSGLAWIYVEYGTTPQLRWLLYGVSPVIVAIIAHASGVLSARYAGRPWLMTTWFGVLLLALAGIDELALIVGAGAAAAAASLGRRRAAGLAIWAVVLVAPTLLAAAQADALPFTLPRLWWFFLKVGSVLFGSGYVLVAFLRADLVEHWGWLTDRQLLDAVAIGQVTPGPLFTTASFIGFILGSWTGAVVATVAIFLPSFVLVALTHRLVSRMRTSSTLGALLDGVTVASLALMAAVAVRLVPHAVNDPTTTLVALASLAALLTGRVSTTWLVAAGALAGFALHP